MRPRRRINVLVGILNPSSRLKRGKISNCERQTDTLLTFEELKREEGIQQLHSRFEVITYCPCPVEVRERGHDRAMNRNQRSIRAVG